MVWSVKYFHIPDYELISVHYYLTNFMRKRQYFFFALNFMPYSNISVLDHMSVQTVFVYSYGLTIPIQSDRKSVLKRSSTCWTMHVFGPYGFILYKHLSKIFY